MESCQCYLNNDLCDNMSILEKTEIALKFHVACRNAHEKINKYVQGAQPGIAFLKACRVFNPITIPLLSKHKPDYDAIPGFREIPDDKFKLYFEILAPEAISASDLSMLWSSLHERVPNLSKSAKTYAFLVTNSADAERSFSLYNLALACRRHSLSEKSIKALVFLYFNNRVNASMSFHVDD